MKIRIGNMSAKEIVNGMFITGAVYIGLIILYMITELGLGSGTTGDSMIVRLNGIVYGLSVIITSIILLVGFKLMCEIVYKIVKAAEIIIEDNKNK